MSFTPGLELFEKSETGHHTSQRNEVRLEIQPRLCR